MPGLVLVAPSMIEGGGSNLIAPDPSLIFIFILFIILTFILNRLLFKPIGNVLDQRQRLTEGAKNEARSSLRLSQARALEYEDALRQARAESFQFLQKKRAVAMEERARLLTEAREQAAHEIENAKSEIARQADQARLTLEREAATIAASISQAVLGRPVQGGAD